MLNEVLQGFEGRPCRTVRASLVRVLVFSRGVFVRSGEYGEVWSGTDLSFLSAEGPVRFWKKVLRSRLSCRLRRAGVRGLAHARASGGVRGFDAPLGLAAHEGCARGRA